MNSLTFMEELFNDKPDNTHILLWQNKRSRWFKDPMSAATHIDNFKEDMYYGVGLSPKDYGATKRCKAKNIAGIPGFYADIDIGAGSKAYPATEKEAMNLVEKNGFDPTMVINSGRGLHVYWLFKEIWMFDNEQERLYAAELSKRLNLFLQSKAIKNGCNIDNVSDLARILRPVGSINSKVKKEVSLVTKDGIRYSDPDVFDGFLPILETYDITPIGEVSEKELKRIEALIQLKEIAEPPADALEMLLDIDDKFNLSWKRKREDIKDDSDSGYHMSLATIAASAKWTDQEITNLLIAWNRRHVLPLTKVLRPDYMVRTLANARKYASGLLADEYMEDITKLSGTEYQEIMKESLKKKAFQVISNILGFEILAFYKFKQEKKSPYKMETVNKGPIYFLGADEINIQSKFEQVILAATNKALIISRKKFLKIKECYEHIIEDVEVSQENTIESRMKAWLVEYLDGRPIINQHDSAIDDEPFVHLGHWHVYAPKFKEWAYKNRHDREPITKTHTDLKIIDAEQVQLNPRHPDIDGKRKTKRPWRIPLNVTIPKPK